MTVTRQKKIDDAAADALMKLYAKLSEHTKERRDGGTAFTDMSADERRAYMREAKQRSRQRQREASKNGFLEPTADNVRSALADAAIRILKDDAPGAEIIRDTIRSVLATSQACR